MDIAIDTLTIRTVSGGIRVYLREMLAQAPAEVRITLIVSRSNRDAFADCDVAGRIVIPWSTRTTWVRILTQQTVLPLLLAVRRHRLLLEAVDVVPLLAPLPIVTCLHSSHLNAAAGYARGLKGIYNRVFLGLSIRRARAVLAISRHVATETQRLFPAAGDKLRVVHHGAGLVERAGAAGWRPPPDAERQGGILFIGTLHPHKRVDALLQAYSRLRAMARDGGTPDLHVVGLDFQGNALQSLQRLAASLDITPNVHFTGRVDDAMLLDLLGNSRLLVLPSEVEGFGLPLLEAMQAGLPVIYARRGALPEIAGSAGVPVDPDDFDAMAVEMQRLIEDPDARERLIVAGLARGRDFSWPRCARETFAVLTEAAEA